jgi:hypothetical protein
VIGEVPEFRNQLRAVGEFFHRIQPGIYGENISQGPAKPDPQQPLAA